MCLEERLLFNTEGAENTRRTKKRRPKRSLSSSLFFAEPAVQDRLIRINAAISQEGPVAASFFTLRGIALGDKNLLFAIGSFGNDLPERIRDKGIAPEFQPGIAILRVTFESHAVHHGRIHAVGNGVAALDRFPSIELRRAELCLLLRMPADAGGIKNYLRAAKRGEPRAFRIPLVPANLHADAGILCVEIRKA